MKSLKKLFLLLIAAASALSLVMLAACGESSDIDGGGDDGGGTDNGGGSVVEEPVVDDNETIYYFEAEYTELTDDMVGTGTSGSPFGLSLVYDNDSSASNGLYVGSLNDGTPLTFKITSSATVTTTLYGRFGNNGLGTVEWTTDIFSVLVNGVAVDFGSFTTSSSTSGGQNFRTYELGEITLNEGENTIVIQPLPNTTYGNLTSAPSVDYIMIVTSATLEMELYNVDFFA